MDEKYRLVFRGELLEGQHKSVVKRRLAELMKLDGARLEKLFSGGPVVIKSDVDRSTAARYQALFKQAGGRLRVLATQPESAPDGAGSPGESAPASAAPLPARADSDGTQLTILTSYFPPPAEPRQEIVAPDFDIANLGSDLLDAVILPDVVVPEANFELADVGEDLLIERAEVVAAPFDSLDFEVLEVGADIGDPKSEPEVSAPDTSHLQLEQAG